MSDATCVVLLADTCHLAKMIILIVIQGQMSGDTRQLFVPYPSQQWTGLSNIVAIETEGLVECLETKSLATMDLAVASILLQGHYRMGASEVAGIGSSGSTSISTCRYVSIFRRRHPLTLYWLPLLNLRPGTTILGHVFSGSIWMNYWDINPPGCPTLQKSQGQDQA